MNKLIILLTYCFISFALNANTLDEVALEATYLKFQEKILTQKLNTILPLNTEEDLFIDALWDLTFDNSFQKNEELSDYPYYLLSSFNRLRLNVLKTKMGLDSNLDINIHSEVLTKINLGILEKRIHYFILSQQTIFSSIGYDDIIALLKNSQEGFISSKLNTNIKSLTDEDIFDIYSHLSRPQNSSQNQFVDGIKLYIFCRSNRLHPCLMLLKDNYDRPVRNDDGSLWSQPALGLSARRLAYNQRNGSTPSGVYTLNSVMPYADNKLAFGIYRRIIINFIPDSTDDGSTKEYLPHSSHEKSWWKQASIARDVGRNLFRIHGTGRLNQNSNLSYFPFMPTSGCIAQRENTYGDITYQDQRLLLDESMKALDLNPEYQNETKIKGLMYVIDIDDKQEPVTLSELNSKGIQ